MSVSLIINVPNIDDTITTYDVIRLFRADHSTGPFVEITSVTETAASIMGRTVGPFFNFLNNKKLSIRKKDGVIQTVTFTSANPIDIDDAVLECNDPSIGYTDVTAYNDGNRLRLTTNQIGADELLQVQNSTAVDDLGYHAGEYDTGEYERIGLIGGTTEYLFEDVNGTSDNFYKTSFYNSVSGISSEYSAILKGSFSKVNPEKSAQSESSRGLTLLRGQQFFFRQSFFEDAKLLSPVIPLDLGQYPTVTIINPNGEHMASGLAVLDGNPGHYRYEYFVPEDAIISDQDTRWQCRWYMITDKRRQVEVAVEFDVRDPDVEGTNLEDFDSLNQRMLAFPCKELRVNIAQPTRPFSAKLDIITDGGSTTLIGDIIFPYDTTNPVSGTHQLQESVVNEFFVYHYTIPEGCEYLSACKTYTLLWTIYKTQFSQPEYIYRIIDVPPLGILPLMTSLRMAIDKFQKQRDMIFAYQDSDLYEYIKRGRDMVNAIPPLTSWGLTSFPAVMTHYLLLGASVWALNAQHLLHTDLNFDFSGQTTVLGYDHAGGVDSGYQRALGLFQDTIAAAKLAYSRKTSPVGVIAGRPYTYRRSEAFVFRVNTLVDGDILGRLNMLGIL